jgi:lipoprotein NlpD
VPASLATRSVDGVRWISPTRGKIIKGFSASSEGKKGINIAGLEGQRVVAAAAGKIVYAGSGLGGYGQLIIIEHNKKYLSAYAHNSVLKAKEGDSVTIGQAIAAMGKTGTSRVMLHFEIRRDGKAVDPGRYLPAQNP